MPFLAKKLIALIILPPVFFVYVMVGAFFCRKKYPRLAKALLSFGLGGILLLSLPVVSGILWRGLASDSNLDDLLLHEDRDAIVIMGCGVYSDAAEYRDHTLAGCGLERVHYGVFLAKKTGLPILVTGGDPFHTGVREADVMKRVAEIDFGGTVKWTEDQSRDSAENAKFSFDILFKEGKTRIFLVTHSWHMWRAKLAFRKAGFDVVPAPTMIRGKGIKFSFWSFIPSNDALAQSAFALHEWLGRVWYWMTLH